MSGDKGVVGVTCRCSRLTYYFGAFHLSLSFLFLLIYTLWLGIEPFGTMPIYVYTILGAAKIAYLGMVIRCLRKDVPVPTYRLGVEGQRGFFLAVMIFMYCISYNSPDIHRLEVSGIGLILIMEGISIVQLSCPAEDFNLFHNMFTIQLGVVFGFAGGIGTISWSSFIASLLVFPISIVIISEIGVLDPLDQLDHDSQHDMNRKRFRLVLKDKDL